jgi:hypothetical protein
MSRIVLHIDRLLLHGIDPSDADALAHALRDELSHHLHSAGMDLQGHRYRLDLGCVRLAHDQDAAALGRAIARRIADRGLS